MTKQSRMQRQDSAGDGDGDDMDATSRANNVSHRKLRDSSIWNSLSQFGSAHSRRSTRSSKNAASANAVGMENGHGNGFNDSASTANTTTNNSSNEYWFSRWITMALQKTVLKQEYYLRRQLFLSFGTTAFLAISFFIFIGVLAAVLSGKSVMNEARNVQEELARYTLGTTARYAAETITKKFSNFETASDMVREATRDRIVGYKTAEFMSTNETDQQVPFVDYDTGRRIYPLNTPDLLKLDWKSETNIFSEEDAAIHLHGRENWYAKDVQVSTAYATYFIQGCCNPEMADQPDDLAYYPNCNDDNNDMSTGGKVAPSPYNNFIATKAQDIVFLLKALFESHTQVKQIGVYFANGGAGSYMKFPSHMRDARGVHSSAGCEWMESTMNPLTGNIMMTKDEVERCQIKQGAAPEARFYANGTAFPSNVFPAREYNPMQRPWCVRQAKATPGAAVTTGPYLDSASVDQNLWIMTFGHGVFDRISNEFIGCTLLDVSIEDVRKDLNRFQLGYSSSVALVRWDKGNPGTVVACGNCDKFDLTSPIVYRITDLQSDVGIDDGLLDEMINLVNFDGVWDPEEVSALYRETLYEKNGQLIMMHPVPMLPTKYDPDYYPSFMVFMSISHDEIYGESDDMIDTVQADIYLVVRDICLIGLSGLVLIFIFLAWISRSLTKPLLWMQATTARVISNAGSDDLGAGTGAGTAAGHSRCAPRTEVEVLLSEFEMMMDNFSGKGAAEVAGSNVSEVKNNFQWREAYQALYEFNFRSNCIDLSDTEDEAAGRLNAIPDFTSVNTERTFLSALTESSVVKALRQPYDDFTASVSSLADASYTIGLEKLPNWAQSMIIKSEDDNEIPDYIVSPPKVFLGANIRSSNSAVDDEKRQVEVSSSSRVFLWVTCIIGIPILLTASAVVSMGESWIRGNLDKWLNDVKEASILLEQDAIVAATLARADFGSSVVSRFMRDLNVWTRTVGWLLFGGLQRSEGFTNVRSASEECKSYVNAPLECPVKTDIPCDCAWNDNFAAAGQCTNSTSEGRFTQMSAFEGQNSDIDPLTGNRDTVSEETGTTPSRTSWWEDPNTMPGASKRSLASGYGTTYDRVRTLSALSAIQFPIYNYFPGSEENVILGSWVGLQADGSLFGYSGCDASHADYSNFQSTVENRASVIAPDLCPLDRYGYDCRCRDWFASAGEQDTYISPPYEFASTSAIGTTAARAIRDPVTSELVAVAELDFLPEAFTNALHANNTVIGKGDRGFPFVITATTDIFGGNTILGPAYDLSVDGPMSILDVVDPEHDSEQSRDKLKETIASMQSGEIGNTTFVRENGGKAETIFLSYSPVSVRVLHPLDPRNFSAGSTWSYTLVYSLGIAVAERDLFLRYEAVEKEVDRQLDIARSVSIAAMILIAVQFIILTYYISLNITRPIIALTKIVKSIKNKSLRDEIPDVEGGSKEVSFVHESFQRLMKVVRFANTAFFAGDRTQSYHCMEDALSLFLKLGNQKAIGVANNNLGTMVLQEQLESHGTERLFDNSLFGVCISEIYHVGINYFDEAVKHGSFEYEISKDTTDQAEYAKQMANRYYNRGMFLIVVKHHPLCPSWVLEGQDGHDGVADLLKAKALDEEVSEIYHRNNLFKNEMELAEFEGLLRRARGILSLVRNFGFEDPWGIDSLITRAETLLNDAEYSSKLFESISRIGRKQQIDDLRIQYLLCKQDFSKAGEIAMRMLVEDEYIIDTIATNATNAVEQYFKAKKIRIALNPTQYLKRETRKAQVNVLQEAKNIFFCLDYSGSMAGERMKRANKNLLWVYKEHCQDKDQVGFIRFNHDIDEGLWFPLGKKGDWQVVQEAVLQQATDAEGGTRLYAALNRCVTQILKVQTKSDTWIVALTDGESSWDHPAKRVAERIKKVNKQRKNKLHVIIIGFEVPSSVIKTCQVVTSMTDKSMYIDARGGLEEMDKAFEQVVNIIGGSAITMETF